MPLGVFVYGRNGLADRQPPFRIFSCHLVRHSAGRFGFTPTGIFFGDDRGRTGNLRLAKPALSQLSYVPQRARRFGVGQPGFEPGTSALSELRSSQLSYTRDVQPNPSIRPGSSHSNKKANRCGWLLATRLSEELPVWGNNPANGHGFFCWGRVWVIG